MNVTDRDLLQCSALIQYPLDNKDSTNAYHGKSSPENEQTSLIISLLLYTFHSGLANHSHAFLPVHFQCSQHSLQSWVLVHVVGCQNVSRLKLVLVSAQQS